MNNNEFCMSIMQVLKKKGYVVTADDIPEKDNKVSVLTFIIKQTANHFHWHVPSHGYTVDKAVVSDTLTRLANISAYAAIAIKIDLVMIGVIISENIEKLDLCDLKKKLIDLAIPCRKLGLGFKILRKNSGGVHVRPIFVVDSDEFEKIKNIILKEVMQSVAKDAVMIKPCVINKRTNKIHWKRRAWLFDSLQDWAESHEIITQSDLDRINSHE